MTLNKYNAIRVNNCLGKFDSKGEYKHYLRLLSMAQAGEITNLKRQVRFDFVVNGVKIGWYTADFTFTDKSGKECVQDFKGGYRLPADFALRKKLVKALYNLEVEIIKK